MGSVPSHDCIAVCAPGTVLTIVLLSERILISPKLDPDDSTDACICSDEIYDLLIRPENGSVEHLLFVSPHVLFDRADREQALRSQVVCAPFISADLENWHYPVQPEQNGNQLEVSIHRRISHQPGSALVRMLGTLGSAEIRFPRFLASDHVLATLEGLGRTVFECHLNPPIALGEQRWLRLRVKPRHLSTPTPVGNPMDELSGFPSTDFCQLLDILGADTMLEAFRDALSKTMASATLPNEVRVLAEDHDVRNGLIDIFNGVFREGFEKRGTYVRIEDHRIKLVGKGCRINLIRDEGCVDLHGLAPVQIASERFVGYDWHAGLMDYASVDPVAVIDRVYLYMSRFAKEPGSAKSKAGVTYAAGVDHLLGCEIIDELTTKGYLAKAGDDGYYACSGFRLDSSRDDETWRLKVGIASSVAERLRIALAKGHFRVFYEAVWSQATRRHKERQATKKRKDRAIVWVAVASLAASILGVILAIVLR